MLREAEVGWKSQRALNPLWWGTVAVGGTTGPRLGRFRGRPLYGASIAGRTLQWSRGAQSKTQRVYEVPRASVRGLWRDDARFESYYLVGASGREGSFVGSTTSDKCTEFPEDAIRGLQDGKDLGPR